MVSTMTRRPMTRIVLGILAEAGDAGMLTCDITQRIPADNTVAGNPLSETNLYLSRSLREGRVRRGAKEPTLAPSGRRSRCYRWYITPAGTDYLTPPQLPHITVLDEPPSPRRVLELLKEAGEEGMLGAVLARHFTVPDPHMPSHAAKKMGSRSQNLQRRLAWTNQILDRFLTHGWARRGTMEPTPYYNNVPAYRWYVTPHGVEYLAAGMSEGLRAAKRETDRRMAEQRLATLKRRENLITQAYIDYDPHSIYKCEREKAIRELRAAGCTLDAVGGVFGLTRERVRQIMVGYKTGTCKCPRCTEAEWFEVGDGATV